ncbi:MAG: hypothetical protein IJ043_03475 [Clostridia bacterium]|nr:hypothetical protein [Clostridia bacterium]
MRRKINALWIGCICAALILVWILCGFFAPKYYLTDDLHFGMSPAAVQQKLGQPVSLNTGVGDTPMDEYIYRQNLYGYPAEYALLMQNERLVQADITAEIPDQDAALGVVESLMEKQDDFYRSYPGHSSELYTRETGITAANKVEFGAVGISIYYSYSGGTLSITAIHQK